MIAALEQKCYTPVAICGKDSNKDTVEEKLTGTDRHRPAPTGTDPHRPAPTGT
jgi:hypothetical protein